MRVGASSIIRDEAGRLLLIRRDDSRSWAPAGGLLEKDELPDEAVVREVREETGLTVTPIGLAGLFFWPIRPANSLSFVFTCQIVGGRLRPSPESPEVRFCPVDSLPRPMMQFHRERIDRCLNYDAGPPFLARHAITPSVHLSRFLLFNIIYPFKNLQRWWRGQPPYVPPPEWEIGAFAIIQDEAGRVLWVKRTDYDIWNLPGGGRKPDEAPWETAVRETREETGLDVAVDRLTGVYLKPGQNQIVLTFTATVRAGRLQRGPEAADFAYFRPGDEPAEQTLPKHIERVADALNHPGRTLFRRQSGPSGLDVLGVRRRAGES